MRYLRVSLVALLGWLLASAAPAVDAPKHSAAAADKVKAPQALQIDDAPQPLTPKRPRTAAEQDRLEALALFAAGRMKEQEQDFNGALRLYQRALRHDPKALPVLEQIVPLAFSLNRPTEAVRYALKAVELDPSDPVLLRRLALHLTEQGDMEAALNLYQKALSLEDKQKKTAAHVVLRLEMGRLYFLTKQYKQSAEAFAEVMEALKRPEEFGFDAKLRKEILNEPAKLYEMFGDSFLEAGDRDRAVVAYEKAQETSPNKPALAYQMARVHHKAGQHDKGLTELQVYFDAKSAGEGAGPYELLADLLKALGREKELIGRLEKLFNEDKENSPLGYDLAERYLAADNFDRAEAVYRQLHEKSATTESLQGLVRVYREQNKPGELLDLLSEQVTDSGGLDGLGSQAKPLLENKELVTAIVAAARSRFKKDPDTLNYGGRLAAAMLALEGKQFDTASEFFDLALKLKPKDAAEVVLMWGLGLLGDEKYAEAAAVFQRGIDDKLLQKENPAFYFYLAGALELAGQTDDALKAARSAVALGKDTPRLYSRVAWIQYHAKRYEDAAKSYKQMIERFDSTQVATEARAVLREARLVLSNIFVIKKDLPQAEEWLEQVLDEFPEDTSALNDLGYLWADQGKHLDRALEMTRKAVAADPDNGAYHDSLGWALFKLGRYDEALVALKKAAADHEPDEDADAVILDHLGDCQHKLGQTKDAIDSWQRALKKFDAKEDADEIKATREKVEKAKGGK